MTNVEPSNENLQPNMNGQVEFTPKLQLGLLILLSFTGILLLSILVQFMGLSDIAKQMTGKSTEIWKIYFLTASNVLFISLIPSLLWFRIIKPFLFPKIFDVTINPKIFLYSFFLFVGSMPFVMGLAWINQQIPLPEILLSNEDNINNLINNLTADRSISSMLICVFLLGILPALGEELFFRGALQSIISKMVVNPHVAILITGIIFGLVHFQFQGIIPRVFLGIILGYSFYFTKTLWCPILLHALFNSTQVAILFIMDKKMSTNADQSVNWILVSLSGLLTAYLFMKLLKVETADYVK